MNDFWLCFVPLFVAVDAIGVLPMFIGLTEGLDADARQKVVKQSAVTAGIVAVAFIFSGPALLGLLGITVADFMVAGGVLLFAISLSDLLRREKVQRAVSPDDVGAVPIGVPLITGPAVLTTSLLLAGQHGVGLTCLATLVNVALAGVVFWFAGPIQRALGNSGSKTLSKIASLLLAAIAVMMVRHGLSEFAGLST